MLLHRSVPLLLLAATAVVMLLVMVAPASGYRPLSKEDKEMEMLLNDPNLFAPAKKASFDDPTGGGGDGLDAGDFFAGAALKAFPTHDGGDEAFGDLDNHHGGEGHHGKHSSSSELASIKDEAVYKVDDPDDDCRFELDGMEYDLSGLRLTEGMREYRAKDQNKMTYRLNVCGAVSEEGSDCQRSNGMVCQYTPGPGASLDGVISRWSSKPRPEWAFIDPRRPEVGVKLTTHNGDDCSFRGSKKTREALIFFPCSERAGTMGTITVSETSPCVYVINIPTELSCPGEAGSRWGWTFISVLLLVSVVYVVAGMLYNRHKYGGAFGTMETVPNREFWLELPALVSDGFAFTWHKITVFREQYAKGGSDDQFPE